MADESWTDKMDRLGRAVWELLHGHPEIEYVRTEVYLEEGAADPEVLATDVGGGGLWVDPDGDNNRQVILPDGGLARDAEWLAKRRGEARAPD